MQTMLTKPSTWIEINKQAFEYNLKLYKHIIGNKVALAVVVKANAYGHGIHEIGQLCQQSNEVDWLCTASLSEALLLRKIGITKSILVMTFIDNNPECGIKHNIHFVAYDLKLIKKFNALGEKLKKKVNIHIKVDTGMSRFGFLPKDALPATLYAYGLPYISVQGIFTHCASATNHEFTDQQFRQFNKILQDLKKHTISIPFRHIAKSAVITTTKNNLGNLVRLGIGAYGLFSSQQEEKKTKILYPEFKLKPILTWKTKIIHIKKIPPNSYVGYDKTYKTSTETTLGLLPIGYCDGYDNRLSNKGVVLINNCYAPIVGTVCMNVITIDISKIPNVHEGDEVVLIGDYSHISAQDLAIQVGSFNPREITTTLAQHIPRTLLPVPPSKIITSLPPHLLRITTP